MKAKTIKEIRLSECTPRDADYLQTMIRQLNGVSYFLWLYSLKNDLPPFLRQAGDHIDKVKELFEHITD